MNALALSAVIFACLFGGALLGMALRRRLPDHHVASDSRDGVKVGMGFMGTMVALVLGLLVASAKGTYDTQADEVTELAADIALLDRVLAHYGPEADTARALLRTAASTFVDRMWASDTPTGAAAPNVAGDALLDRLDALTPRDEHQRKLQDAAREIVLTLARTRWLLFEQRAASVSVVLLIVLVAWLTILFTSFGLFAPPNLVVIASFFLAAFSVASALLIIMEMYSPFSGLIQISSAPLRAVIAHVGM